MRWTAAGALGCVLAVYAAILLIDPYDTVPFSPRLDREPIARDKRFALPGLARKPQFDSAIVGSSTMRLLRPSYLNEAFGAAFVNLSLEGSLLAEQWRGLAFFLRHHPRPKAVILGLDPATWCQAQLLPAPQPRPMPDRLYDDNRWRALPYLLSLQALQNAGTQLFYLAGLAEQKWGKDGYTAWPQSDLYDSARAERLLYPHGRDAPPDNPIAPKGDLPPDRAQWRYDNLAAWYEAMLDAVPPETLTIAMVPPAHRVALSLPGTPGDLRLQECKRRIAAMTACRAGAHVVDFAFDSNITRHDRNFWDPTHVTLEVAERVQALLVEAVRRRQGRADLVRYVDPAAFRADDARCGPAS